MGSGCSPLMERKFYSYCRDNFIIEIKDAEKWNEYLNIISNNPNKNRLSPITVTINGFISTTDMKKIDEKYIFGSYFITIKYIINIDESPIAYVTNSSFVPKSIASRTTNCTEAFPETFFPS